MFSLPDRAISRSLIVECVDRTQATMYLEQSLTTTDAQELRHLVQTLPPLVRVLRVQLRAAAATQDMMNSLRELVRAWRPRGNVHLVFVGGFAVSPQQTGVEIPTDTANADWISPAHTAAFL